MKSVNHATSRGAAFAWRVAVLASLVMWPLGCGRLGFELNNRVRSEAVGPSADDAGTAGRLSTGGAARDSSTGNAGSSNGAVDAETNAGAAEAGVADAGGGGPTATCGDSEIEGPETCDDGNRSTEACACDLISCVVCGSSCTLVAGATSSCGTPDGGGGSPECGDDSCNSGEDCASCAADCGACPAECGNASCESGEDCANCAADCGACPAVCGNASCESGEDCANCAADCGACPAVCGNASCESGEDCANCAADCGACPAACGNASCESGEDCANCATDCGVCVPAYQSAADCSSSAAALGCNSTTDGNYLTYINHQCYVGDGVCNFEGACATSGCVQDAWVAQDLGGLRTITRVRYLSDWWLKRPNNFEVWASNDPSDVPFAGATLVASGVGHPATWVCVAGESCNDELVPDACCPAGRDAPQDPPDFHGKYDILDFTPYAARYWYLVVRDSYDLDNIMLMDLAFYGTL